MRMGRIFLSTASCLLGGARLLLDHPYSQDCLKGFLSEPTTNSFCF